MLTDRSPNIMMAIASVSAGWIHLILSNPPNFQASQQTFGQGYAAGVFFAALAIFQFIWAAIVLLRPNHRLLIMVGALGSLLSIIIYLVAVVTPLPIGVPQQRLNVFATATKSFELIFIVGSLKMLASSK